MQKGRFRMHSESTTQGQPEVPAVQLVQSSKAKNPKGGSCEECGAEFTRRTAKRRFCSRACYQQWWRVNVQSKASAKGRKRLAELRAAGQDPSHGGEAAKKRGEKIALSNRLKPRRRKGAALIASLAALEEEMDEDAAWAERGRYWEGEAAEKQQQAPQRPRRRRKIEPKPLVLNGHGVRSCIHQGSLVVQNGFTHYPQERQELRLFPGDQRLPSRIVALDSDGSISLDVIKWLSQQQIPLVLLNWQGEVVSVVGAAAAYDPELREAQLAAQKSGLGLRISTQLIRDKINYSQVTLRTLPSFLGQDLAVRKLEAILEELELAPPESTEALRLIEARAALAYFTCWQLLPLQWKGTGRRPIPPEWHNVGVRQSLLGGNNRHATHPVNAMLNYAYAVLESQVRIATVAQGLDPTIGYLHACRPKRVALVYDLMEPLRPHVDRLVLDFVRSHTFYPNDFVLKANGVCRLHPQVSRHVTRLAISDAAMQEMISWFIGGLKGSSRL